MTLAERKMRQAEYDDENGPSLQDRGWTTDGNY